MVKHIKLNEEESAAFVKEFLRDVHQPSKALIRAAKRYLQSVKKGLEDAKVEKVKQKVDKQPF